MFKRRGDVVTLDELIALIGVDATRFFMLQRSHDTTVDLDLDLALREADRFVEGPLHDSERALIKKLLALGVAAQHTIARSLDLLGVSAPQTM